MKSRLLSLFLALLTILPLSACAGDAPIQAPAQTQPTLPEFQKELTPLEQLTAAGKKTKQASSMVIQCTQTSRCDEEESACVTSWQVQVDEQRRYTALVHTYTTRNGGDPTDEAYLWYDGSLLLEKTAQGVTRQESDHPYGVHEIFSQLGGIPENDALLDTFCAQSLTVSPSKDGSFLYQVRDLTQEDFSLMLYGESLQLWDTPETVFSASILVDPQGYLSQLEFVSQVSNGQTDAIRVHITQLGEASPPEPPDWVSAATS